MVKRAKEKEPVKLEITQPYLSLPWPIKSGTVSEIMCNCMMEKVGGAERAKFMEEAYRVLVPNGKMTVVAAYWSSVMAIQDYMNQWPPLAENSFLYFNKGWREANKIAYPLKCDFDFTYGYIADPETASRNEETRNFWTKHYLNSITHLQVVLTKRP